MSCFMWVDISGSQNRNDFLCIHGSDTAKDIEKNTK